MPKKKEWTVMFYFASDNPLAPGIVPQLKALKNAGYHPEVNVVVYFDPQPSGTPTHIFDVNAIYKLEEGNPRIGFTPNDPYVRNLMLDKLWGGEVNRVGTSIRALIQELWVDSGSTYNLPKPPQESPTKSKGKIGHGSNTEPGPENSLGSFLKFCARKYKAKHYMLFILGHGVIVGNDVFLYDEHGATNSITLKQLGDLLQQFKDDTPRAELELISFHSCSMSGLEVAFQLQGKAKYMLASQGPAFVGNWPYTQILVRLFNDVGKRPAYNSDIDVEKMVIQIFDYVLHNSTDFILAGHSFDVALCDLRKLSAIEKPLQGLSQALIEGLKDGMVTNCILLAHLQSQSHWEDNYTDFYDFCFCLYRYCEQFGKATGNMGPYKDISDQCDLVMNALRKKNADYPDNPIVLAEFAGPASQYSHGLSIFFPWTRPIEDKTIMQEYETSYEFRRTNWFKFLDRYWGPKQYGDSFEGSTMRKPVHDEFDPKAIPVELTGRKKLRAELREDMFSRMFNAYGLPIPEEALVKTHPLHPLGGICTCGSMKNYFYDTRKQSERRKGEQRPITFPASKSFFARRTPGG